MDSLEDSKISRIISIIAMIVSRISSMLRSVGQA
jgi:hypothetical protein